MARLNDYAAPAESVDALKRRFVRQNREIMRVNSMQSMRIRSLESEVSHLLSENVSLRGQIITLTQENERLESGKALQNGVYEIKARLDAKLAELNSLRPPPRLNDPEYNTDVEEGKLPPILEDKYFPRRTLESQEVQRLVEGDSCMPESPQADDHLVHNTDNLQGNIENANEENEDTPSKNQLDESASPDRYLPPTLETRKKKKKPGLADTPIHDVEKAESTAMKSGSKRKFSLDDDILSDLAPEDDFQFSRLNGSPQKKRDSFQFMGDSSPSKTPVNMKRGSSNKAITNRKVLEPKSANTNLATRTPKKTPTVLDIKPSHASGRDENRSSPQKSKDLDSKTKPPPKPRGRPPLASLAKQKRTNQSTGTECTDQIKILAPKDSPIAKSIESMSEMSDAGGRPSRRRGAAVSYAEPSLRAKMRRPSSNMADAVTDRRSSSFQLGRESLDGDDQFVEKPSNIQPDGEHGESNSVSRRKRKVSTAKDIFDQDDTNISSQRQSRRHSSNPKTNIDLEEWSQVDSSFEDDFNGWKLPPAVDAGHRRETRVSARRRSMMV
ncbi:uncharacterized protein N7469_006664 [Penicillium citrinum]|uniref:Shugoshin n=1 Tax=Penicillium citrinum TaxID=5077 RepID=A0A9W9NX89_PENCI|nr:uncharacterized protein N7469_006664 [Penicillium citrinum]KAJ5226658.1 hypothetical protein N7469_006664 [Penicillium citrinum]